MIPRSIALEGRLQGSLRAVTLNGHLLQVDVYTRPSRKDIDQNTTAGRYGEVQKRTIRVAKFERDKLIAQMVREDEELVAMVITLITDGDI